MNGGHYSSTHLCLRDGMVLLSIGISLVVCCRSRLGDCDSVQPHLSSSVKQSSEGMGSQPSALRLGEYQEQMGLL